MTDRGWPDKDGAVTPTGVKPQALPHNTEAEQFLLSAGMLSAETVQEGIEDWFFDEKHRIIYNLLVGLKQADEKFDPITAIQILRDRNLLESTGGENGAYVMALYSLAPTAEAADHHRGIVQEHYARRVAIIEAERVRSLCLGNCEPGEVSEAVEKMAEKVSAVAINRKPDWAQAIGNSILKSSELESLDLPPREKFIGDWFCEGDFGYIFASRGVGKTWLALLVAKALAERGEVGPWKAHVRTKVLYIDGEMPADLMRDRDNGLTNANGEVFYLSHEVLFNRTNKVLNITDTETQKAILELCIRHGIKVVILDNLSTLASGMKENDSFGWEPLHNWLLQFRRHKIAVILVHHAGRNGEARGTSKREDPAFWIIRLDDAKKDNDDKTGARFISWFTKPSRNTQDEIPPYEWHVTTDKATGRISVTHKPAQSMDVILRHIGDGITDCSTLADYMSCSKGHVSKLVTKAIKAGKVRKVNREYFLADGNEPL